MNVRKSLFVVTFAVLTAPLAAYADAPSGDFAQTHPAAAKDAKVDRGENRNNAEFTVSDLVGKSEKTREEVKRELAANPMPHYGA